MAGSTKRRGFRIVMFVAISLLACVAAVVLVRIFLFRSYVSPSGSMIPTINVGDRFVTTVQAYRNGEPEHGDVVVFLVRDEKTGTSTTFVKRVEGLPGDKVQMVHGKLHVNGVEMQQKEVEPFVKTVTNGAGEQTQSIPQYVETLPNGRHYNVIDLIGESETDNTEEVVVPSGDYFVIGDNRDNSNDSRTMLGLVPRDHIVGRVDYLYRKDANGKFEWQVME